MRRGLAAALCGRAFCAIWRAAREGRNRDVSRGCGIKASRLPLHLARARVGKTVGRR